MNGEIFKPTREGLEKARQKRIKRWKDLENQTFTKEQRLERMKLDIEVFESMKTLRERANQFIDII